MDSLRGQDSNHRLVQFLDYKDNEAEVHIQSYIVNANTRKTQCALLSGYECYFSSLNQICLK